MTIQRVFAVLMALLVVPFTLTWGAILLIPAALLLVACLPLIALAAVAALLASAARATDHAAVSQRAPGPGKPAYAS